MPTTGSTTTNTPTLDGGVMMNRSGFKSTVGGFSWVYGNQYRPITSREAYNDFKSLGIYDKTMTWKDFAKKSADQLQSDYTMWHQTQKVKDPMAVEWMQITDNNGITSFHRNYPMATQYDQNGKIVSKRPIDIKYQSGMFKYRSGGKLLMVGTKKTGLLYKH